MQYIKHVIEFTQILKYKIRTSKQLTCSQRISGAIVLLLQYESFQLRVVSIIFTLKCVYLCVFTFPSCLIKSPTLPFFSARIDTCILHDIVNTFCSA